jgi:predicted O-linked N-acetylglucosamine transferase (SPINDLY family)
VCDAATERLRQYFDSWRIVSGLSAKAAGEAIHGDGIDVLIDLSGYTAGGRMDLFALKPAPVQMTYLGYPTTTGLPEIDYRITDWQVDPAGSERFNSEQPVRMPHSYFCYRPSAEGPGVAPLPALTTGHVTFASFNNMAKLSDWTLQLWARVLANVSNAKLLVKSKPLGDAAARSRFVHKLEASGIDSSRVELLPWRLADPLRAYDLVDIALDSCPYNGATTTCEALWMGVPVVTIEGNTHPGRMGASLLRAAGFDHLVAQTDAEYIELAISLASDLPKLAAMRQRMRALVEASPLRDEPAFARSFGDLLKQVWRTYAVSVHA